MQIRPMVLAIIFSFVTSIFSQITPIGDLHRNDSQGVPLAPFKIGTTVTVSGIVTVPSGLLSKTNFEIYLQDASGGINVFAAGNVATVALGDSITVTGKIDHFRGLTEIKGDISNPLTIIKHSSGHRVPEPLVLTCKEIDNSFLAGNIEPNESRLVMVKNVQYAQPSVSSGGTLGELTDNTGKCQIFLDIDTGLPEPVGRIHVVGILKQYDASAPYTSGYEIIPRYSDDIDPVFGPKIIAAPIETDIRSTSITLFWRTETPASGSIEYGLSKNYEIGSVVGAPNVTDHSVIVSGLTPATFYHCRALSVDGSGQSKSNDLLVSTASPDNFPAVIMVFFNQSVDTGMASEKPASGLSNFEIKLIDQINQAKYSIDFCMHELTLETVKDVLIAAHRRGVKIRYIHEQENTSNIAQLKAAGIPCIDDKFGSNDGSGRMHNKFIVFDARDGSGVTEDWVWTGSFNATYAGKVLNAENVILIKDMAVARAFSTEFNEMWGSETDIADPAQAKFSARKSDNTPHRFNVGGRPVEVFFSPGDGVAAKVVQVIESSDQGIYFCIYNFTRDDFAITLRGKWQKGIPIKGVFDSEQISDPGNEYPNLAGTGPYAWSPPADVLLDRETGVLHHKYMIIDPCDSSSDPTLVTGSYNWSISAEQSNDENIVIVHDAGIVNQYLQEFSARYHKAGGQDKLCKPTQVTVTDAAAHPHDHSLAVKAYPNPFNDRMTIRIFGLDRSHEGELRIYNIRGERINAWLLNGSRAVHTIFWNATDSEGAKIGSGIYFAVCRSGNQSAAVRLLYLR